ncbi:hypothetical protein LCL85_16930 [Vibrio alginolyticus]|nr:hypothetical protein [Vibrio alginolyticus]
MDKFVVFLLCLCLTAGGVVHIYDNLVDGLVAYDSEPYWLIIYLKSLGALYLLAAFLLIRSRRIGLILMVAILLTNVTLSSHMQYALEILNNHTAIQMNTLFLGFSIGVSIWLWNTGQHRQSRQIFR